MNARFWPRICWSSSNCHIIPGKSLLEHVRNFAPWVLTSEHIWCWTDWLFQNILHNTYFKENSQFNWLLWHKARSSRDQKYGYRKCATTAAWRSDEYCFGKWLVKRNPLEWPRKSTQALAPTLYCANQLASDQGVASKSTFYRVLASSGWKKKIKFSPPSSHSKCSTCSRLKGKIQSAKGIQAHTEACDQLLRHLAGQFSDRACYWECRNRSKTSKDILCIISDSMDRSKFSLPRFHRGRVPKDIENTKRPSCEMTTQIVHGVGVYTYLSDEDQTSGTTWVLETLNRTLQAVQTTLGRTGKPTPPVLKFFADNTPKEAQLQ